MKASQRFSRALALHQAGNIDQAAALYQKVLQQEPGHHAALNLLGLIECQRGRWEPALRHLQRAISVAGGVAKYHYDLAVALHTQEQLPGAIEAYFKALECDSGFLQAWENLGVALFDDGQLREATEVFQRALSLNGSSLLSLSNLATLLRWQGDHPGALTLLERALQQDPLNAEIRMKRAELLLAFGHYDTGWAEYSWRFERAGQEGGDAVRYVHLPKWSGEALAGKSLLIHAEQGIGDEVMFASCLGEMAGRADRCTVLCDRRLTPIFRRSFPSLQVLEWSDAAWGDPGEGIDADFRLPMGDLARQLRRSEASFAQQPRYLLADANKAAAWDERIGRLGSGLRVGIAWRGGRDRHTRRARSLPLAQWEALFVLPDVVFVNLQYGDCGAEIAAAPETIRERLHTFDDIDPLTELDEFFALISTLDVVVSIDNSTVHFAGALGTPTLALLPALADWRWPATGAASRWYPSVRLIRQEVGEINAWGPVLDRAVNEIRARGAVARPDRRPAQPACEPAAPPRAPPARRPALLINDTAFWYHWGCTGTSLAIRDRLHAAGYEVKGVAVHQLGNGQPLPDTREQLDDEGIYSAFAARQPDLCRRLQQAELVVINGEGTLHGANPAALALLYVAYLARTRFDTPVRLINHSCYPADRDHPTGSPWEAFYQGVYEALGDAIVVREPVSARLLTQLGVTVRQGFDCLPLFIERHRDRITREPNPRVLIAGSAAVDGPMIEAIAGLAEQLHSDGYRAALAVGANAHPAADDRLFARALSQRLGGRLELVHCSSVLQWLSAIASAPLLVSGRFHHSIAAAATRTPFVVLDSNTPKTRGLMEVLGLPSRLSGSEPDLQGRLCDLAARVLRAPADYRMSDTSLAQLRALAEVNFAP